MGTLCYYSGFFYDTLEIHILDYPKLFSIFEQWQIFKTSNIFNIIDNRNGDHGQLKIGTITRNWFLFNKGLTDSLHVDFPIDLEPRYKAMLLAAAFKLDFVFSAKSKRETAKQAQRRELWFWEDWGLRIANDQQARRQVPDLESKFWIDFTFAYNLANDLKIIIIK